MTNYFFRQGEAQVMLFLSGASALGYELVWARLLGQQFGHTLPAVTIVLAVFMGGLALGSVLFGGLADRIQKPLKLYACLELGIGTSCFFLPHIIRWSNDMVPLTGGHISTYPIVLNSVATLIVPTILMGGTLPVLTKTVAKSWGDAGSTTSKCYGANTLGAAFGVLFCGYWGLGTLGLNAVNNFAVSVNLLLAFWGWIRSAQAKTDSIPTEPDTPVLLWDSRQWILALGVGVSGAAGMAFEIGVVRAITPIVGSSTYALAGILVAVLMGIGVGGRLSGASSFSPTINALALLHLAVAFGGFIVGGVYNLLPAVYLSVFRFSPTLSAWVIGVQFFFICCLILPCALALGAVFGTSARCIISNSRRVGGELGRLYLINTIGAVIGTVTAGFFLIPYWGTRSVFLVVCGLASTMCVALSLRDCKSRLFPVCASTIAACMLVFMPSWSAYTPLSSIAYRWLNPSLINDPTDYIDISDIGVKVVFHKEDTAASVAVTKWAGGRLNLWVNGKVDGGNAEDMVTQIQLAALPLIHHPNPQDVMVVGMGTGVTAGTALLFDTVRKVEVAEMSPSVYEASKLFDTYGLHKDPRYVPRVGDGRNILKRSPDSYDVIISEPSNPWMAGINNLFTKEFFSLVRSRLRADGIFCQWLQGYDLTAEDNRLVVRTFLSVFPQMRIWTANEGTDYLLVGFKSKPQQLSFGKLRQKIGWGSMLETVVGDPVKVGRWLVSGFLCDEESLVMYAGDGPLNTDDLPILEFAAPKSLYSPEDSNLEKDLFALVGAKIPAFLDGIRTNAFVNELSMCEGFITVSRWEAAKACLEVIPPVLDFREFDNTLRPPLSLEMSEFSKYAEAFLSFGVRWEPMYDPIIYPVYEGLLRRISGVVDGVGSRGGPAIVLRSVHGLVYSGYRVAVAVEPENEYRITLRAAASGSMDEAAGVGILEFDLAEKPKSMSIPDFINNHKVDETEILGGNGPQAWRDFHLSFKAGPRTKSIWLAFYRKGPGQGNFLVDHVAMKSL